MNHRPYGQVTRTTPMNERLCDFRLLVYAAELMQTLITLVLFGCFATTSFAVTLKTVTRAESLYADLNDATAAISTIDSGYAKSFGGHDRAAWASILEHRRKQLKTQLAKISPKGLSAADARAVKLMRESLASAPASSDSAKGLHCVDGRRNLDYRQLRSALYACFEEVGNNLEFEGKHVSRGVALGMLEKIGAPERRKALFLAMTPLYEAINGKGEGNSPYRRMIKLAAADDAAKHKSELDNAARTLGVKPYEVEHWLEQILDGWRQVSEGDRVEPWDYRYQASEASRQLDPAISRDELQSINERYYRDLGANLEELGVIYDLDPRLSKSPVAYTDFARRGRMIGNKWQPTIARVLASYSNGGLGNLNEYVHENGHAVQISAIHTRSAFMDWGDTLFVEAFADVTSWNTYNAAWQKKYLGRSAPETDNLRALYSGVMLDVAWSLFEIRILRDPDGDPNRVWTDITSRYLHIVPHPELSWWAVRGQLVDAPGYMINYGLGAVLTADLRQHVEKSIGPFVLGNPNWYPWLTMHLLRYGTELETSDLLREFFGRRVSPEALLRDIRRARGRPLSTSH